MPTDVPAADGTPQGEPADGPAPAAARAPRRRRSPAAAPAATPAAAPSPEPDSVEQVRLIGEQVRDLAEDLSGHHDDVADLLEPRPAGSAARDEALADPDLDEVEEVERRSHSVTAVIVAHDGARWLPATLTAFSRSTRRPDRVVAVDSGSTDSTAAILERAEEAGLIDRIVTVGRETPFGAAVAAAVATGSGTLDDGDSVHWLWLLHDDSAPSAGALNALLLTADIHRSADVLGPKLRGWRNQALLVEAGVTVARSGDRVTGLERRELDQGQHDGVVDVLAVSSAGMLVRREAWDAVGGFDAALPMYRDDVDFCWRVRRAGYRVVTATDAVVHHREAATRGRRPVEAGSPGHPDRPRRLDRAAAIHLMRAHVSGPRRPFVTFRLLIGSLVRAIVLLLGKAPDEARDEWGAFRDAIRDRGGLRSSRARVTAAAQAPGAVPESDVRHLLAPRGAQARHALESLADVVAGRETGDVERSVLDSTPDDPDGWYADDRRPSRLRRLLSRPVTLLVLALLAITVVGVRGLLGEGVLLGGALLPAPDGAGDLWASYTTPWHQVGPGSAADAPAWLVPLTVLAGLMRGSASVAVDVVLLLAIPLAGLTSFLALRGVVTVTWARVWAAAAYASLPAVTGAMSGGRLGSAVAIVLLPWLARSAARLVGVGAPATWRRAFGTAILLAVVASFTPVVWLVAVVLAVVAAATMVRDLVGRLRLLVTLLTPVALLVPWSLRVLREPALLWLEPGLTGPTDPGLNAVDVVLLRPGGPGSSSLWLGVGIVVAGLVALAVPGGRRPVVAAWTVGVVGLLLGIVETLLRVTPPALSDPVAPWPGVATVLWAGGLIVAVALTVDRLPRVLAGADFGWRQAATGLVIVALLAAPVASLGLVVLGVDGPLTRGSREVLPAFVAAEMRGADRPRALVLHRGDAETLVYDLLSAPEPQTGDLDVAAPRSVSAQFDRTVALLAAGVGADEVDSLATHGVRYVVLTDARRRGDPLVAALDGQRGLRRLSARGGSALWQVVPTAARAQAIDLASDAALGSVTARTSTPVPTVGGDPRTPTSVDSVLPAGAQSRTLLLAETVDDRWRWVIDGATVVPEALAPSGTDDDAAPDPSVMQVAVDASAASLEIDFDGGTRRAWLWAQGILAFVVVILALPSRRREVDDTDDDDAELDVDALVTTPAVPKEAVR